MVDERALDAACREFKEHLYIPGKTSDDERTAIKAAIEAYEAAKLSRTIDPPKQDAVSQAVSAPPAAEASS